MSGRCVKHVRLMTTHCPTVGLLAGLGKKGQEGNRSVYCFHFFVLCLYVVSKSNQINHRSIHNIQYCETKLFQYHGIFKKSEIKSAKRTPKPL